ncbi:MAG TPA: hypothetical protein VFX80_03520, partial [Solirubrobacteraceae bacterium]|nr:hypothetical protein [Solirubrobacteraceae bacterium]
GDGISAAGAGHTLTANRASLNGGWGIYAPLGAIDGGNNFAAGNAEPGQCLGIECIHGEVPGAPDTKLVSTPPAVSNSRNASFTYTATDDITSLVDMVFECRLDSTDPLAWEDCEYPHELLNLSPGEHTLEIRAIDLNLLADPTPASYTWTYEPLPSGRGPEVTIEMKPDAETWLVDSIFTFHADEPDVTFECRVDLWAYEPCGFESANFMNRGAFEWGLEETEVGLHTFSVRAIDFEGNRGPAATYTWRLLGVVTEFLSGPGFTPGTEGEPATGGETQGNTATIDFRANVSDATYLCSLDLEPFEPCTPPVTFTGLHAPGEHLLRVISIDANGVEELEPAEYEWEILDPADNAPPETTIERAPQTGTSSAFFEFAGTDDFTIPARLTFECRVDSTSEADWFECQSPYSLLETYTYEDPQLAPGEHTFEVRAIDDFEPLVPDPQNPNFEGNPDPTPATYTWTSVEDTTPPGTAIVAGPAARTTEPSAAFEFAGSDNATPGEQLAFECSLDGAPFEPCSSPEDVSPATPGEHTLRVRTVDLAGNADPTPAARTWTIVPAPVVTITSGPIDGETSDSVTFAFTSDQPGSTFECSFDGASFAACTSPYTQQVPTEGGHTLEVRAVNAEGLVSEEPAVHEWIAAIGPDGTRPDTTITVMPPASTMDQIATFEFTGIDNRTFAADLAFECSLDGAPFEGCE